MWLLKTANTIYYWQIEVVNLWNANISHNQYLGISKFNFFIFVGEDNTVLHPKCIHLDNI